MSAGDSLIAQFRTKRDVATSSATSDADTEPTGPQLALPVDVTPEQLQTVLNKLLENVSFRCVA